MIHIFIDFIKKCVVNGVVEMVPVCINPFISVYQCIAVVVLELCLDKATCMSLWGEKEMVQRETFADEGHGKEKASMWRAVTGFPSGSKRHQVSLLNPGSELPQAQNLQVGTK